MKVKAIAALLCAGTAGVAVGQSTSPARICPPGSVFRDCPACPEMVIIPAGGLTMGSSPAELQWAATHRRHSQIRC
jgi:hypothetical protein